MKYGMNNIIKQEDDLSLNGSFPTMEITAEEMRSEMDFENNVDASIQFANVHGQLGEIYEDASETVNKENVNYEVESMKLERDINSSLALIGGSMLSGKYGRSVLSPKVENDILRTSGKQNYQMKMEGITDIIKTVWEKIKAFFKKIWDFIFGSSEKTEEKAEEVEKKAEAVEKKVSEASSKDEQPKIEKPTSETLKAQIGFMVAFGDSEGEKIIQNMATIGTRVSSGFFAFTEAIERETSGKGREERDKIGEDSEAVKAAIGKLHEVFRKEIDPALGGIFKKLKIANNKTMFPFAVSYNSVSFFKIEKGKLSIETKTDGIEAMFAKIADTKVKNGFIHAEDIQEVINFAKTVSNKKTMKSLNDALKEIKKMETECDGFLKHIESKGGMEKAGRLDSEEKRKSMHAVQNLISVSLSGCAKTQQCFQQLIQVAGIVMDKFTKGKIKSVLVDK